MVCLRTEAADCNSLAVSFFFAKIQSASARRQRIVTIDNDRLSQRHMSASARRQRIVTVISCTSLYTKFSLPPHGGSGL